MILSHEFRASRAPRWTELATLAGVLAIAAATGPLALLGQRTSEVARMRAWMVQGPACPVMSRSAFAAFGTPIHNVFSLDGVRFGRAYGDAACARIPREAVLGLGQRLVCQFTTPTIVEVSGPRGHVFFRTDMRAATVTIDNGEPDCVLGARREPNWERR